MPILDDEDTIEAQALSTSLDPYGQLIKMLMPRALCIAVYDSMGTPLWLSDGCDGPDLLQIVEEALNSARSGNPDPEEHDGFARSWDGDTAYVFLLRDGAALLGAVAISATDSNNISRPFSLMLGLLRPALQVLCRELANQFNMGDLRKNLAARDDDLALLLDASAASDEVSDGGFEQLLSSCTDHLECSLGALQIPDRHIALAHSAYPADRESHTEVLRTVHRHLFAFAQVQRRTLVLNKAPPQSPFGSVPYKILACPIQLAQTIVGVLSLYKPATAEDFDVRTVRIAEMMARRIACLVQSSFDSVTGLLAHPTFQQRALAVLSGGVIPGRRCVAYGDIDGLHVVNDTYGMHVGDMLIKSIAECMRNSMPSKVLASHICGDRFGLFFTDASLVEAQRWLTELCHRIAKLDFSHDSVSIEPSISFGLAAIAESKSPLAHALADAETACRLAKDRGRGRVEQYCRAVQASEPVETLPQYDDSAVVEGVREAIATDRFRMEAQPLVRLDSNAPPRRFELLLRMIEPNGESVGPDKFLAAAERHKLAMPIDRWVVQYALEILSSAATALDKLGAHFAINLSGQSVADETFPQFLENVLRDYGLPPRLLAFEISETAALANVAGAEMLVRRLRDLGHATTLDDFGMDLSSLNYLKSLPVADLKIDSGLVLDLASNSRARSSVTAIVNMARSMHLNTTAECVESEAILTVVRRLGLDYGQGYAIGRPRSLEVVLQELLRGAGMVRVSGSPLMSRLAG